MREKYTVIIGKLRAIVVSGYDRLAYFLQTLAFKLFTYNFHLFLSQKRNLFYDIAVSIVTPILAITLQGQLEFQPLSWLHFIILSLTLSFINIAVIMWYRTYQSPWSILSIYDVVTIFGSASISMILSFPLIYCLRYKDYVPYSLGVIQASLFASFILLPRLMSWLYYHYEEIWHKRKPESKQTRVLLVGDNISNEILLHRLNHCSQINYQVLGLISNNSEDVGQKIYHHQVLSNYLELPKVLASLKNRHNSPHRLVLTALDYPDWFIKLVREKAGQIEIVHFPQRQVSLPRVGDLENLISNSKNHSLDLAGERASIRRADSNNGLYRSFYNQLFAPEDLLVRDSFKLNLQNMKNIFRNNNIMITCGYGLIIEPLVKIFAEQEVAKIYLLTEGNQIAEEEIAKIRADCGASLIEVVYANLSDPRTTEQIIRAYDPDVLIHSPNYVDAETADSFIHYAVQSQLISTYNLVEGSILAQANNKLRLKLIAVISPDCALFEENANIKLIWQTTENYLINRGRLEYSGANKISNNNIPKIVSLRIVELITTHHGICGHLLNQMNRSDKYELSHPDAVRYLVTPQEGAQLIASGVVYALTQTPASMRKMGAILRSEIGPPTRIVDLLNRLISLLQPSNIPYTSDGHIAIEFTGLRHYERLSPDLRDIFIPISGGEMGMKVFINTSLNEKSPPFYSNGIEEIAQKSPIMTTDQLKEALTELCREEKETRKRVRK